MKNPGNDLSKKLMIILMIISLLFQPNIGEAPLPPIGEGGSPTISFIDPTDSDGVYINRTHTNINVSVSDKESPNDLTAFINWNNSLIGWWRFNENDGVTLTDHSGNDNNGTLNNFDWTSESNWTDGKFGSALRFDGNNDYVQFGSRDSSWTKEGNDYTLEAWIKPVGFSSESNPILASTHASYNSFAIGSSGTVLRYRTYDGNNTWYNDKSFSFSADTWYHVAFIYDQTNDLATWYVNGNSLGTKNNLIQPNRAIYLIGATSTQQAVFNGTIDEVRIHKRTLSPEEISASYNAGLYRLYKNFTKLSELTLDYIAYVQDLEGNINQTERRTVTIDTIPPIMNIISPLNDTTWTTELVDLKLNFDSDVPKMWYSVDNGINITAGNNISSFQTTINLAEGSHNIIIYANNGFGELISQTTYFAVNSSCVSGETYGEWNINTTINCSNVEIIRHGTTIIQSGGTLNWVNVTMQIYGNMYVNAGGTFNFKKSTLKIVSIESREVYHVDITGDSNIENSTIISWNPNTNITAPKSDKYKGYIKFLNEAKVNITNNNFINLGGHGDIYPHSPGLYFDNVVNPIIQNNTFNGNFIAIKLEDTDGALVEHNIIESGDRLIWLHFSSNINIRENYVNSGDIGILLMNSENIMVYGNTIINMTTNEDAYDVGILLWKNNNIIIENNNLIDIGSVGISVPNDNTNLIIKNNNINMMELSKKYSTTITDDWNDPIIGIGITQTMKSSAQSISNVESINITNLSKLKSKNIIIENNTFGSNVQVLLYIQGTENLTHDLTNYWMFSYLHPIFMDRNDLYISNKLSNITHISRIADRTEAFNPRNINNVHQQIHTFSKPNGYGRKVYFNYIVEKGNITILPQGYKIYVNGTVIDITNLPHDFYLYSPAYTPFGLNKPSTIYTNGTTHIFLYNDIIEPNGYHTINMTLTPSSASVNVTVLNFTNSHKKWIISAANPSITVHHKIGDFTPNSEILIKKNGVDWNSYVSNSDGYVSFVYNESFTTLTFEAELIIPTPPDTLSVSGIDLAPSYVVPGQNDVEMSQLILTADSGLIEVTEIHVDLSGTGLDTDIAAVKLYEDIDNTSTLTFEDIQLGTSEIFLGGTLTFLDLALNVSNGTSKKLLVVYDISDSAIGSNSIGCLIVNNTYITVVTQNTVNPFTTINSFNSTIQTDIIPPTVVSIDLSDTSPIEEGFVTFTIQFSEDMNTTINPSITFGQSSPYTTYPIIQLSFVKDKWMGTFTFDNATGDGSYRISVAGAEDLGGNLMESHYISNPFEIDTTLPISSVNSLIEYQNHLTFYIPYMADDGSGSGIKYIELYYRQDSGSWIKYNNTYISNPISFTASSEGFYEFYTKSTDNAGNIENAPPNVDASTTVDTTLPTIQSIDLSDISPLKTGNVTFTITFNEEMNTTISPIVTFGLVSPYDTNVISESFYSGNTWIGTFEINEDTGDGTNRISISGAEDSARNQIVKNTSCTFVIDTRSPEVISITPIGKDIAINTTISITFNEIMNQTSAQNTLVFTDVTPTRTVLTGFFIWSGNTITFIPDDALNYGTKYIVSIGTDVKDLAENNLVFTYTCSFITVQSQNNIPPRIDYIQIRDESKGEGDVVDELTFTLGGNVLDIFYCAAYNYSIGYIGEADAKWIITGIIGSLSPSTGTFSSFVASTEGTGIISAELAGIINSTRLITVKSAIDPSKLQVPTNVTVKTLSIKEIEIKWSLNNGPNVESYIIQRSTNSDGPWDNVNTVDKNRDSYIDSDLKYDTTYYYRVIAIDNAGNEASPSRIVSTTTDKTEELPLFWVLMIIVIIGLLILVFSTLKKDKPKEVSLQLIELKKELPPPPHKWKFNREELSTNGNNKSVLIDDEIPEDDLPPLDDWDPEEELCLSDDEIPEDDLPPPDDWIDEDELPPPDD